MIESGYIIDGASFVLFNSFCHRECIVVGPARSGVAFEPNSWAGAAGTPPWQELAHPRPAVPKVV